MPRLSDSMEEGTIVTWLIEDGGAVVRGQELVEIETDKATITHAAEVDGMLAIVAQDGTTLAVGATIARIERRVRRPHGGRITGGDSSLRRRPRLVAADRDGPPAVALAVATPLARRVARCTGSR